MIGDEQRARIRRLFYAEHWKVGTIADELGVHHDTVRRALEAERFRSGGPRVVASVLAPYNPFLDGVLREHPRLRSSRLFGMIKERGYTGSEVIVRRYVQEGAGSKRSAAVTDAGAPVFARSGPARYCSSPRS